MTIPILAPKPGSHCLRAARARGLPPAFGPRLRPLAAASCATAGFATKAPGRDAAPQPNPPPQMVEEKAPVRGLRGLIRKLFDGNSRRAAFADRQLASLELDEPVKVEPKYLHTDQTTNLLYWYCIDLSFAQSDFERVGPRDVSFKVTRARNPVNLTRWMGYFLEFDSNEAAQRYYEATIGHELSGFPLKLRFAPETIQGFMSPLLSKAPISRRSHVVALGFPPGFPETQILRVLWDYDLVDDDRLAVERMPMETVKYGGNPVLFRFKTEREAERFVREYNLEVFPYTENKIFCEVVD